MWDYIEDDTSFKLSCQIYQSKEIKLTRKREN